MFLQVSVILFGGGCLVLGGLVPGGSCSGRGVCLVETPRTATAAGGTHPTRMHSCYPKIFINTNIAIINVTRHNANRHSCLN